MAVSGDDDLPVCTAISQPHDVAGRVKKKNEDDAYPEHAKQRCNHDRPANEVPQSPDPVPLRVASFVPYPTQTRLFS